MKEARYVKILEGKDLRCQLCPHECLIGPGEVGRCKVRRNIDGVLYSENYGKISAIHVDPVEKKPLRHFMEGSKTLSLGSFGCNFHCPWCQNYNISLEKPQVETYSPEAIVDLALELGVPSISYTYNEPTVFLEFVLDTARLAKSKGLKNIYVSNGYIASEPLEDLLECIDACNLDVKTFDPFYYKKYCGGELEWVKRTVEKAASKIHVELTALLVTGVNDKEEDLERMFRWIASVDPAIPLHLSRYFPTYHYHEEATSPQWMVAVKELADQYLKRVYLGNV